MFTLFQGMYTLVFLTYFINFRYIEGRIAWLSLSIRITKYLLKLFSADDFFFTYTFDVIVVAVREPMGWGAVTSWGVVLAKNYFTGQPSR